MTNKARKRRVEDQHARHDRQKMIVLGLAVAAILVFIFVSAS